MESTSPEKLMDAQTAGRNAAIVAGMLRPVVDQHITNIVQQLISMYRAGETGHDQLLGKVAELASLSNLMSSLETMYRKGIAATNMEHRNASGTP